MDAKDTQAAIAAAHSAQCGWAALTCKVRADIDIDIQWLLCSEVVTEYV